MGIETLQGLGAMSTRLTRRMHEVGQKKRIMAMILYEHNAAFDVYHGQHLEVSCAPILSLSRILFRTIFAFLRPSFI